MIFVACSGFPVPVSRYWTEFPAVEITETELGIPGEGTVRRWLRESPDGFAFSLIAPQTIAASGFQRSKDNKALTEAMGRLANTLSARAIVFVAPEDFKPNRNTRAAVKSFVDALPAKFPRIVLDLPAWKPAEVVELSEKRRVVAAYDPTGEEAVEDESLTYLRLPGPAGRRSRYDEAAIDLIAEHCRGIKSETTMCVFRNIDMHANAGSLKKKLR